MILKLVGFLLSRRRPQICGLAEFKPQLLLSRPEIYSKPAWGSTCIRLATSRITSSGLQTLTWPCPKISDFMRKTLSSASTRPLRLADIFYRSFCPSCWDCLDSILWFCYEWSLDGNGLPPPITGEANDLYFPHILNTIDIVIDIMW